MKKKIFIGIGIVSIAFVVTAAILLFSGPHMKYQPSLKAFEAELKLPPEDAIPFVDPKNDFSSIATPAVNKSNIEKGKVFYGYYCIFCHGNDGKGNGPVGHSFVPKPADLNSAKIAGYDSLQLYNASFKGIHAPVLENVVAPEFRKYILVYIKEKFANSR
ncbi:MAG TPA: hypothetical protein VHO72_05535 [Bacteroidales bacterium]|nr:hypothetical protein [Bacteroidales bacterium]